MNSIAAKLANGSGWIFALTGASILLLYYSVIQNLVEQWWSDENYSHGLLVPFVIALIIWQERESLRKQITAPNAAFGIAIVLFAFSVLLVGTLGAELFSQRVSLVLLLAGIVVYFWGHRVLGYMAVPFLLILLAIPIPQIILNKVSFPLQLLATQAAKAGMTLLGISSTRKGNVIELVPYGGTVPIGLEVVEACSGIRSLVTLVTLAVVLAYFGRTTPVTFDGRRPRFLKDRDLWRGALLVGSAVPIALITNASRVLLTGLATYKYGAGVADSWWHDAFGWLTFLIALLLLLGLNVLLAKFLKNSQVTVVESAFVRDEGARWGILQPTRGIVLLFLLLGGGALISWVHMRTEMPIARKPLSELPLQLGGAFRPFADTRFSPATEEVLKASDYIMRDYILPPRRFNLYVGYYDSQRTGSTYHSPQHCLPGSGWEMSSGETIEFTSVAGRRIVANRYIVRNGASRNVMIYWYQGRGRANASEYLDKIYTVADSISKGRSDGAMVRVMTPIYSAVESDLDAFKAAESFSGTIADSLTEYVPD